MLSPEAQNEYDHKIMYNDLYKRIKSVKGDVVTLIDSVKGEVNHNKLTLTIGTEKTVFESNGEDDHSVTIPYATTGAFGLVKVGKNLTIGADGVLNADAEKVNVSYSTTPPQDGMGEIGDIILVGNAGKETGIRTYLTYGIEPTEPEIGDLWYDLVVE